MIAYGASLVEHCLTLAGFPDKCLIGKNFNRNEGFTFKLSIFKNIIFQYQ
jgi:hypothetical protein